jgi:hypothetical protein
MLLATAVGHVSLAEAVELGKNVCDAAAERGLRKVLLDCFAVEGELSVTERFVLGKTITAIARRDVPLDGNGNTVWFRVLGRAWHGEHYEAPSRSVSPAYFRTLGAKLSRGAILQKTRTLRNPG